MSHFALTASALVTAVQAVPVTAGADEGELHVRATPGVSLLVRHEQTNVGFGGRLRLSHGLHDFLDLEGTVGCDHFVNLQEGDVVSPATGVSGDHIYDATRYLAVPGLGVRLGDRLVGAFALGLGYRFEMRTGREIGTAGVRLERPDSEVHHQLVGMSRVSIEYRVTDLLSVGAFGDLTSVIFLGGDTELDLSIGAAVAGYFYQ